jgi:hypothetical protein
MAKCRLSNVESRMSNVKCWRLVQGPGRRTPQFPERAETASIVGEAYLLQACGQTNFAVKAPSTFSVPRPRFLLITLTTHCSLCPLRPAPVHFPISGI